MQIINLSQSKVGSWRANATQRRLIVPNKQITGATHTHAKQHTLTFSRWPEVVWMFRFSASLYSASFADSYFRTKTSKLGRAKGSWEIQRMTYFILCSCTFCRYDTRDRFYFQEIYCIKQLIILKWIHDNLIMITEAYCNIFIFALCTFTLYVMLELTDVKGREMQHTMYVWMRM